MTKKEVIDWITQEWPTTGMNQVSTGRLVLTIPGRAKITMFGPENEDPEEILIENEQTGSFWSSDFDTITKDQEKFKHELLNNWIGGKSGKVWFCVKEEEPGKLRVLLQVSPDLPQKYVPINHVDISACVIQNLSPLGFYMDSNNTEDFICDQVYDITEKGKIQSVQDLEIYLMIKGFKKFVVI